MRKHRQAFVVEHRRGKAERMATVCRQPPLKTANLAVFAASNVLCVAMEVWHVLCVNARVYLDGEITMQVNASQSNASSLTLSAASRASNAPDFQAALDAAQQSLVASGGNVADILATRKTAGEELAEYQSKSVAQHLREAILKEMGLTEGDLDAMPPEQRAAIEDTIAEKIEERLLAEAGGTQASAANPAASLLSLVAQGQAVAQQLSPSNAIQPG